MVYRTRYRSNGVNRLNGVRTASNCNSVNCSNVRMSNATIEGIKHRIVNGRPF